MTFILHNGAWIAQNDPVLTIRDRALRGDGVFDTMLAHDGAPVYASEHFERLKRHALVLNMTLDMNAKTLIQNAKNVIDKNNVTHGCITTTITRGTATRGLQTPQNPTLNITMRAVEIPPMDHIPLTAIIAETVRKNEGSPISQIKSLNYGDHILAKQEAENAGVMDAIMMNNKGHATCFTIGNLFIIKDGDIITPALSDGCMDGIIRSKIINKINVKERSLDAVSIENADGVYLTNSLRGIVPVTQLNGKTLAPPPFPIDDPLHLG